MWYAGTHMCVMLKAFLFKGSFLRKDGAVHKLLYNSLLQGLFAWCTPCAALVLAPLSHPSSVSKCEGEQAMWSIDFDLVHILRDICIIIIWTRSVYVS